MLLLLYRKKKKKKAFAAPCRALQETKDRPFDLIYYELESSGSLSVILNINTSLYHLQAMSLHIKSSNNFFPVSTPRKRAALAGNALTRVGPSPLYSPRIPR